ncbi:MAG TPA: ABC transporter ATP-binding protein, partial [Phytomonospora sp.]
GAPGHLLFGIASQLTLLALAATAAALFLDGTLTAAALVALIVVAVRFLEPFTTFGDLAQAVTSLRGTIGRVTAVLDAPALPVTDDPAPAAGAPVLAFEDVAFTYDGADRPAVDGVSFTVERGGTTAIVGPSGSGKSTLLALAARLHDADTGTVRIHGRSVRSHDPLDLAAHYAVVHQNVYLFEGTLRDNVLLGRRDADDDALASAATRAGLDEVVARLPEGWSTRVGEGGATLSGGERQRVGLARALLKDAPLLLLDEVTSALDTGNEKAIVEALSSTAGHRATVIIAHRLDTIIGADQVVFLDGGKVREIGAPAELIAADGHFARYWAQRRQASGWHLVGAE